MVTTKIASCGRGMHQHSSQCQPARLQTQELPHSISATSYMLSFFSLGIRLGGCSLQSIRAGLLRSIEELDALYNLLAWRDKVRCHLKLPELKEWERYTTESIFNHCCFHRRFCKHRWWNFFNAGPWPGPAVKNAPHPNLYNFLSRIEVICIVITVDKHYTKQ